MAKKTHITKIDNLATEVAVQMRADDPVIPSSDHIWYNSATKKLSIFKNGSEQVMNVRVMNSDPATAREGEVWINHTASSLNYMHQGIVRQINFGAGVYNTGSNADAIGYLKVLDDAELKIIADISGKYPDYFIESFQDSKISVVSTALIESSRMTLDQGITTGNYQREEKTSSVVNHTEGILVASLQSLAPKDITNNLDGTHTITFHGDVTGYFKDLDTVLAFEIVSVNGADKNIFLLDALNKPALISISGNPVYDNVLRETTLLLTDNTLDLTLGYTIADWFTKVRFAPFNIVVESAGDGLAGTLSALSLEEAHSLDAKRILGKPLLHEIQKNLPGAVNHITVKQSPSKQYTLIAAKVERAANSNTTLLWYSTDFLKTINQVQDFQSHWSQDGASQTGQYAEGTDNFANWMNDGLFDVDDSGKFVFGHYQYSNNGYHQNQYFFGDMSGVTFWTKLFPSSHHNLGQVTIGANYHMYDQALAMDWSTGHCSVAYSNHLNDPYCNHYIIDWANKDMVYMNYSYLIGVDHWQHHYPAIFFWEIIEGEKKLFWSTNHNNGHAYAVTIPQAMIDNAGTNHTNIGYENAFTASLKGGTKTQTSFAHQHAATNRFLSWVITDSKELVILKQDSTSPELFLYTLNLGRTHSGRYSHTKFTFDAIPDAGVADFSLERFDQATPVETKIGMLTFGMTAVDFEAAIIANYAWLNIGDVTVSGDWATGFVIDFLFNKEQIDVTITNSTLTNATVPLVITTDISTDFGAFPVWLHNLDHTDYIYHNDIGSYLYLNQSLYQNWSYDGSLSSSTGAWARFYKERMRVVGNTIYIVNDFRDINYDYDYHQSYFIKIPDYTQLQGYHYEQAPGALNFVHLSEAAVSLDRGDKLAQLFTVPSVSNRGNSLGYATRSFDGKFHIRTMSLYMARTYFSEACYNPNHYIWIKCVAVVAGVPDETNVIATSNQIREFDICQYDDVKWHFFNFDDLRLNVGQQVAFIVEGNWNPSDALEINPTGLSTTFRGMIRFAATSQASSNYLRLNNGVWENQNYNMFMRFYDYYISPIHQLQNNTNWMGPSHLVNHWGSEDSEGTLEMVGDPLNKKMMVTYRNSGFYQTNNGLYTGEGSSPRTFYGEIDDSAGIYNLPIAAPAKILGIDQNRADPFLKWGVNLGDTSSQRLDERTGKIADPVGQFSYRAFGGVYIESIDANAALMIKNTGAAGGIIEDADFLAGFAYQVSAHNLMYRYGEYDLFPGARDFCLEIEMSPNATDMDNTWNMAFNREGFGQFGINTKQYYMHIIENPTGAGFAYKTISNAWQDIHHFVRYGRRFDTGFFIERSLDGVTWEDLPFIFGDKNRGKGGKVIGNNSTGYQYSYIGRYYYNRSYDWHGKLGVMKLIVGADRPAYHGLIRMEEEMDVKHVRNLGDKFIYRRLKQNTWASYDRNIAQLELAFTDEATSVVETKDHLLKYKSTISTGRDLALKVTLSKVSDEDPSNIQGMLFNFNKI